MKRTMKMIISLVLTVTFLALMGCRNDENTTSPEPTLNPSTTQDVNASKAPIETEKPEETIKPGQPFFASLGGPVYSFDEENKDIYLSSLQKHDLEAIRTFLEIEDENGVRNGEKMNEWYSPDDPTTWFYSPVNSEEYIQYEDYRGFCGLVHWDGGRIVTVIIEPFIQQAESSIQGFVGDIDLSHCESLRSLKIGGNNIKNVNLEGCKEAREIVIEDTQSLETINFKDTKVSNLTLDGVGMPMPVESLVLDAKGLKQIDWTSIFGTMGTNAFEKYYFNLKLNSNGPGAMELYAVDEDVYYVYAVAVPDEPFNKFIGWYDAEGNLVSTDEQLYIISELYDCVGGNIEIGSESQFNFEARFE